MSQALQNDPLAGKTVKQIYEDCIWFSDETKKTKIFLLCISRFFNDDARSSSMSYAQVARECGLSKRHAKNIAKYVSGTWLKIEVGKGFYTPGKGFANLYHGVIPQAVADAMRAHNPQYVNRQITIEKKKLTVIAEQTTITINEVQGMHPVRQDEVHGMHPEGVAKIERGAQRDISGCTPCTRTAITSTVGRLVSACAREIFSDVQLKEIVKLSTSWGPKQSSTKQTNQPTTESRITEVIVEVRDATGADAPTLKVSFQAALISTRRKAATARTAGSEAMLSYMRGGAMAEVEKRQRQENDRPQSSSAWSGSKANGSKSAPLGSDYWRALSDKVARAELQAEQAEKERQAAIKAEVRPAASVQLPRFKDQDRVTHETLGPGTVASVIPGRFPLAYVAAFDTGEPKRIHEDFLKSEGKH